MNYEQRYKVLDKLTLTDEQKIILNQVIHEANQYHWVAQWMRHQLTVIRQQVPVTDDEVTSKYMRMHEKSRIA